MQILAFERLGEDYTQLTKTHIQCSMESSLATTHAALLIKRFALCRINHFAHRFLFVKRISITRLFTRMHRHDTLQQPRGKDLHGVINRALLLAPRVFKMYHPDLVRIDTRVFSA